MTGGLQVKDLTVEFSTASYVVRPLSGLSFDAADGELVVILGPSGCGKTTLLSCLAGLLTPTSGSITFGDTVVTSLAGRDLAHYRRHTVGVVFQAFNLIPSLSALRNVMAPMSLAGVHRRAASQRAASLLETVGLGDRAGARPAKLSGGQQQRVAIARALVHDPPLVIADEPTAHLDHVQVEGILRLVRELASPGRLVLIATHDDRVSRLGDRIVELVPAAAAIPLVPFEVNFDAGQVIFMQEDPSDVIYVVEEGEVEIFRMTPEGAEVRLTLLAPGVYFGELGPILRLQRSASARATTATRCTAYPPEIFTQRFLQRPRP